MAKDKLNHTGIETAEILALQVLAFIAGEPARLQTFIESSGISLDDLHQRATDHDVLHACLDAVMHDESALLMFCANAAIEPDAIAHAERALARHGRTDT